MSQVQTKRDQQKFGLVIHLELNIRVRGPHLK